jgi:hypothetical protein
MRFEMWCFVLPPMVVGLSLAVRIAATSLSAHWSRSNMPQVGSVQKL